MGYTISEVASIIGVSTYTLRFYDRQGLLPFVNRNQVGNREFKIGDFEWLAVITCLKRSGMPIKKIKELIDLCMEGDKTLEERFKIFENHKKAVLKQITDLEKEISKIDYKIWYYKTALEAGTEKIHSDKTCILTEGWDL